jgi:predicted DNA-binding protein
MLPTPFPNRIASRAVFPYGEGMRVTLDMPKEIEAQFTAAARARGVPLSDYVRDFIVEHYQEDADDLRTAQERLADPQPGITTTELRKNLGLDG